MTTNVESRLNSYSPAVLSLFRVVFGLLFTSFGTSHVFNWPIAFHVPTGSWPTWSAGSQKPRGLAIPPSRGLPWTGVSRSA